MDTKKEVSMKNFDIACSLEVLQKMAKKSGAEINITPDGISLWTSDASDFTCQDVSPTKAVLAIKAIKDFRKYWSLGR